MGMAGVISLSDAIDIVNSGKSFDIEFVTADRNRAVGGDLKFYKSVVRTSIYQPKKAGARAKVHYTGNNKHVNPVHSEHGTFNIYVAQNTAKQRIVKVHTRLITQINGKDVL